jgi:maltose alpha-D-glucosyltransferase/alpha-amylase
MLAARREECLALIDRLRRAAPGAVKTRVHGDYHLGQVLVVGNDVMILDFEGEPSRAAEERRAKSSPLRDVAGMLRSFAYAAETAGRDVAARFPEASPRILAAAESWRRRATDGFLDAYAEAARGSPVWVEDAGARSGLLRLHLLAKALYEVNYEASNRPDWIDIPVQGVLSILDQSERG